MSLRPLYLLGVLLFFAACGDDKKSSGGPIVLGDSSTIVTETDTKFLSDYVDDIRTAAKDTLAVSNQTTEPQEESTQPAAQVENQPAEAKTPAEEPKGNGLKIAFKEVTIFIPNVETRTYRKQDLQKAHGATYQWLNGKITGNQLQISGATINKVSQRYITKVAAKTELGTLQIDALGTTTDWKPLKGSNNKYLITGLEKPEAKSVTPAQIRLAVSRAARNKRMSRQNIQKWEQEVRSVRSVNQAPFHISLRSVMWKIEGKDSQGKPFQKQVRIDINS
ncbi:MAG TPA: hypothetical protein PL009_00765 [Flavipsychrobacter sp.]|nr:hypothetical protein [Flavipsychrobacter sp.]